MKEQVNDMDPMIKKLILKAQAGNESAYVSLVRLYEQSIYIKAMQLCKNEADAKDITQETLLELHRSLPDLREIESFYSWLMTITVSKCHMKFRKDRHILQEFDGEIANAEAKETRTYMIPSNYVDNQSEQEILYRMIHSLTPKQSEIIEMMYLKEMKLSEIAKALDLPLGTVKTRSLRAREELRKKLEEYEKREGRKLHFHVDVVTPIGVMAVLHQTASFMAKKSSQTISYVSSHAVMSACVVSMSVLGVSGGVFLVQDQQLEKQREEMMISASLEQQLPSTSKQTEEPVIQLTFQPVTYEDHKLTSYQEAYYACINFAKDETVMKEKTKDEILAFQPVYEQLKQSESPYYQALVKRNWNTMFETYANAL